MRLILRTPAAILADIPAIAHLGAEDASGGFGILPGHAPFVTLMDVGIVTWRLPNGQVQHAAVDQGLLTVDGGDVALLARHAVIADDLDGLGEVLHRDTAHRQMAEKVARSQQHQLGGAVMKRLLRVGRTDPAVARLQGDLT